MNRPAPKRRIVVADDTRFWREKICRLLEPADHRVVAVDNGDEAIRLCLDPTRPVDLLILDLVMPGTDGFEVARTLRGRRLTSDLPIVAVTSLFKKDDFPNGPKAQGFDAVLEKAASPDQFMFIFNKYLNPDVPARRPAQRLATFLHATLRGADGREARCAITNLSRSGAFVSTATLLDAGSAVSLSFALPEGPTVKTRALVLRVNDWGASAKNSYSRGMGVLFEDIAESTAQAIEAFVQRELDGENT